MKLDSRGNLVWAKEAASTAFGRIEGATEAHDGGFVAVGDLLHSFLRRSAVIIKFDTNGDFQWGREIGGDANNEARNIAKTADGGYVITGRIATQGQGGTDALIMKVDGNGVP